MVVCQDYYTDVEMNEKSLHLYKDSSLHVNIITMLFSALKEREQFRLFIVSRLLCYDFTDPAHL